MESNENLLIVVDPGHGGFDNGASFQGRLEKNDNLRLGLAVRDALQALGMRVLMTRSDDTFIPLRERAAMANDADADLFVSLHRNSYTEQTPSTKGVENFIYLTAPEATARRAARLVLDNVVNVGVQADRGVNRGNYYVLRRTNMPAMLLEMGFIINEEDNRLFDENLYEYAAAIARGVQQYFGTVPAPAPAPPGVSADKIRRAQQALNNRYRSGLAADGIRGPATRRAAVRALQTELNSSQGANLTVDGVFGPAIRAAIPNVTYGYRGGLVYLLQTLLLLAGYDPGTIDGTFGARTRSALLMFQRDHYLTPDGIAGPNTFARLLS